MSGEQDMRAVLFAYCTRAAHQGRTVVALGIDSWATVADLEREVDTMLAACGLAGEVAAWPTT